MDIFGISLSKLVYKDFFYWLVESKQKQICIFTPNPEILLLAKANPQFTLTLSRAQYLLPDGIGLYIAFQIIDSKLPIFLDILLLPKYIFKVLASKRALYEKYGERICGSDLTKDLLRYANEKGVEIVVIDLYSPDNERKREAQKIFEVSLKKHFPDLKINYFIWKEQEKENILKQIAHLNSPYVFSCLGMKIQEENILEILEKCSNVKLAVGVGGSFDYFSGFQKRAPTYIRQLGFEWLYRLFFGPQKIKRIKRLYNAVIVFIYEVIKTKK